MSHGLYAVDVNGLYNHFQDHVGNTPNLFKKSKFLPNYTL